MGGVDGCSLLICMGHGQLGQCVTDVRKVSFCCKLSGSCLQTLQAR